MKQYALVDHYSAEDFMDEKQALEMPTPIL